MILPQKWNRGKTLYMVIRYGLLVYISLHFTSESEVTHEVTGLPLLTAQLFLPRRLQELLLHIPKGAFADRPVHHIPKLF